MKFLFLKDDFDLCIMDVEKKLIGIYKSFYVYSVISFWLLYLNVLLCIYDYKLDLMNGLLCIIILRELYFIICFNYICS